MTKYYYIPQNLELELSQIIDTWDKSNAIVIVGTYKQSNILDETDSTIFNRTNNLEVYYIKNGYLSEQNIIFGLIGFCLEADFDRVAPEYNNIINSYSEILQFEKASDYLEWLSKI